MMSEVEKNTPQEEVVSMELPAPSGWKKQGAGSVLTLLFY
ncbi:hypothetical protein BVRB_8g194160 isoform C [Beta vulgaris subsp. vulgaris]|nr:hypothetical protein BVRB_8g194160 isoform C [Beta vulgaris subsp. vulgaris]